MTYLLSVAPDEAEALRIIQHNAGFAACINGVEFQEFRPAAWQEGWLDANELGAFAPIEFFRINRKV